jgi:hypothetical protein
VWIVLVALAMKDHTSSAISCEEISMQHIDPVNHERGLTKPKYDEPKKTLIKI